MEYISDGFQSEQGPIVHTGTKYEQNLKIMIIFALFGSGQYSDLCSRRKKGRPCPVVVESFSPDGKWMGPIRSSE